MKIIIKKPSGILKSEFIPDCLPTDLWETPDDIKQAIYNMFGDNGYMFDPCPADPQRDGLKIDWLPYTYVNPPYSRGKQLPFVEKAIQQAKRGCRSVMLLPADTSTKLWHDYIMPYASGLLFVRGRIKFKNAPGKPKFGSVLVIFEHYLKGKDNMYIQSIKFNQGKIYGYSNQA